MANAEPSESYTSKITLGPSLEIELNDSITSTRIELVWSEGDAPLGKLGAVYGQIDSGSSVLRLQLPSQSLNVERVDIRQPLFLVALSGGQVVHKTYINNSDVPLDDSITGYGPAEDLGLTTLPMLGWDSISTNNETLVLRIPTGHEVSGLNAAELIAATSAADFYVVRTDLRIQMGTQIHIVQLNRPQGRLRLSVNGKVSRLHTYPNLTYEGWPDILVIDGNGQSFPCALRCNGVDIVRAKASMFGRIEVTAKSVQGEIVARKSFGVLPAGFYVTSVSGNTHVAAKLVLRSRQSCTPVVEQAPMTVTLHVAIWVARFVFAPRKH